MHSSIGGVLKQRLRPAYRQLRQMEFWLRHRVGRFQSEGKIAEDAQNFWNNADPNHGQHSHWLGSGIFIDHERWLSLGKEHLQLYDEFVRMLGVTRPLARVVEWGCGGGANAIHFARLSEHYIGIDIAQASLDECGRQLNSAGLNNFTPILIDAAMPEQAAALVPKSCDLFLSTYVFELLPTPEYGLRILDIAHDLLADDGLAIIQIRYTTDWKSKSKRFAYRQNFVRMTSYALDVFWSEADRRGLVPKAITLVPRQPLVEDGQYAYFLLQKRSMPGRAVS